MKAIRLIEGYLKQLHEQDEDVDVDAVETDPAKKYIIKLLVNAFLFDITKLAPNTQDRIRDDIESIHNSINQPIASLVTRIKRIINMDRSLTIESKTYNLLTSYLDYLEENKLDATEPQAQNTEQQSQSQVSGSIIAPTDDKGEVVDVNLVEVFPAYKDLILAALEYTPATDEGRMVEDAVNEMGDDDPAIVVDVISGILNSASADNEVEDDLVDL